MPEGPEVKYLVDKHTHLYLILMIKMENFTLFFMKTTYRHLKEEMDVELA